MIQLYYYPGNASLLPHIMLREARVPHELVLVDRTQKAHQAPAYLRLNPNGLIPVLIDGDVVLYETAAIALYLAEKHPEAGMAPPVGSVARPDFLRWMVHLTNTPQAEFQPWFYPHKFAEGVEAQADVKRVAERRMNAEFDRIAGLLGDGPWLLGKVFSAADLFLFMLVRWGRMMPRPPGTVAGLRAHAERVLARPAVQAALAAEGVGAPFY
jgi:glutathione S-transferase